MEEIILVGGGGHCRSCIEVIESTNEFKILGIVDKNLKKGTDVLGYPVLGNDADLPTLKNKCKNALITVGQMSVGKLRNKLFSYLIELGFELPIIIANSAVVSQHAEIGKGTIVMHQVCVNANAKIGDNCILNTKSLVEHDCVVGNTCHVSTFATLNGGAVVGDDCFIGSKATILENIEVAHKNVIGSLSLVASDTEPNGIYVGIPCKKIKDV